MIVVQGMKQCLFYFFNFPVLVNKYLKLLILAKCCQSYNPWFYTTEQTLVAYLRQLIVILLLMVCITLKYKDFTSLDINSASSWTLTSLIAAFSSSPWRAGLFPVSFMDRPKSMMTHVPSALTRIFRLFRSLWETAGLYKSWWMKNEREKQRGSGEDTEQKKWANSFYLNVTPMHPSQNSLLSICSLLRPFLCYLLMNDNIHKIPSYRFPFPLITHCSSKQAALSTGTLNPLI